MKHHHVHCPFCEADICEAHKIIADAQKTLPHPAVSLCPECGEIILLAGAGFRRPTEDEYVDIYASTTVREARDLFIRMKNKEADCNQVTRMWRIYCEERLVPSLEVEFPRDAEGMFRVYQDIFFSGVGMAVSYAKHHINITDTRAEFLGRLYEIEMELNAYHHWATHGAPAEDDEHLGDFETAKGTLS